MSARVAPTLVVSLALAAALAAGLGVIFAPEVVAPPEPVRARPARAPSPARSTPAASSRASGLRAALSEAPPASQRTSSRQLTVTGTEFGEVGVEVPVDLLFGAQARGARQRLLVGSSGAASWRPGDPATWPTAVDLGFPTMGAAVFEVGEASNVAIEVPQRATVQVRAQEVDGEPCTEVASVALRVPSAPAPADRWHPLRPRSEPLTATVEAAGQIVEVRVTTRSGREARTTIRAPSEAGGRTLCEVSLSGASGVPFSCVGLPQPAAGSGWWVELFGVDGARPLRAPRDGDTFLAFTRPGAPGAQPIDDGGLVLARAGDELWWGVLAARVARMTECTRLARGDIVGVDGRGIAGAPLELVLTGGATLRVLRTVRAGRGGAFELLGPDAGRVPLALRVPATGEVIALPQRQPLSLRAFR